MPTAQLVSLIALCIHYSSLTILMHLSRTRHASSTYRASSAVVVTELFKLAASILFAIHQLLVLQRDRHSSTITSPNAKFQPQLESWSQREDEDDAEEVHPTHHTRTQDTFEPEGHQSKPDAPKWNQASDLMISDLISQIHTHSSRIRQRTVSNERSISNSRGSRKRLISGNGALLSPNVEETTNAHFLNPDHSHRMAVEASPRLIHPSNRAQSPIYSVYLLLDALHLLRLSVFSQGWWLLSIPAVMFIIQNNLQYLAASNLSVPLFQITYQLKILTTALCSVLLLKRSLKPTQWLSLLALTVGVAIVQSSSEPNKIENKPMAQYSESETGYEMDLNKPPHMNQSLGLIAVVAACFSSGFASVYLERMFKATGVPSNKQINSKQLKPNSPFCSYRADRLPQSILLPPSSIWIKNIQLSSFGLIFSLIIVLVEDHLQNPIEFLSALVSSSLILFHKGNWNGFQKPLDGYPIRSSATMIKSLLQSKTESFFVGFSNLTWIVILFQVLGGILNSFVMKFSNNINKNFSICLSIIISILLSQVFSSDHHHSQHEPDTHSFNIQFCIGSFFVFFSTWLYNV